MFQYKKFQMENMQSIWLIMNVSLIFSVDPQKKIVSFTNLSRVYFSRESLFADNARWNQLTKYLLIQYACCQKMWNFLKTGSYFFQICENVIFSFTIYIFRKFKTMNPFNPNRGAVANNNLCTSEQRIWAKRKLINVKQHEISFVQVKKSSGE